MFRFGSFTTGHPPQGRRAESTSRHSVWPHEARVEKQTGWTSEQLEHLIKRYKRLPSTPTKEDLDAVAVKLLAKRWNSTERTWTAAGAAPYPDFVKMVVGYALTSKMCLPAVADTILEARYQARKAGRVYIIATDT